MARILAYTSPARGHLFPLVPVLDELQTRGHEIALRTLAAHVEMARARGFRAAAIDAAIERQVHDDYQARSFHHAVDARVERFISHRAILERAICAVTHGGMGATQKALAAGVPVCAVPFGRDQLEVARRVEVACAGSRLPASRLRADRLRAKVREAIDCRDGAIRIAEAYRTTGGPAGAASACEQQLNAVGVAQPSR